AASAALTRRGWPSAGRPLPTATSTSPPVPACAGCLMRSVRPGPAGTGTTLPAGRPTCWRSTASTSACATVARTGSSASGWRMPAYAASASAIAPSSCTWTTSAATPPRRASSSTAACARRPGPAGAAGPSTASSRARLQAQARPDPLPAQRTLCELGGQCPLQPQRPPQGPEGDRQRHFEGTCAGGVGQQRCRAAATADQVAAEPHGLQLVQFRPVPVPAPPAGPKGHQPAIEGPSPARGLASRGERRPWQPCQRQQSGGTEAPAEHGGDHGGHRHGRPEQAPPGRRTEGLPFQAVPPRLRQQMGDQPVALLRGADRREFPQYPRLLLSAAGRDVDLQAASP